MHDTNTTTHLPFVTNKGIDAWSPIRSFVQSFLVLLIDHHAFCEESLAICHAFENNLSPDADGEFMGFLF